HTSFSRDWSSDVCSSDLSVRESVSTSFIYHTGDIDPTTGRPVCHDVGGLLLHDMRARNLAYAVMPRWHQWKWHHMGALSWGLSRSESTRLNSSHVKISYA